ncbi:hypothetical protein [Piscinibacter terrae]|uniref:hypothetical protein n=1 Tax=Piscinibacter terrae TaxID=2496871 RepID=UPI000F5A243C|nr:hypothetical protein [Albitalea terrae]
MGTVDQILQGISGTFETQCKQSTPAMQSRMAALEAKGDKLAAFQMQQAEQNLCHCLPDRMKALRQRLKPAQLNEKMTEAEFITRYGRETLDQCTAAMARAPYGEGCAARMPEKPGLDAPKYCACMAEQLKAVPDNELTQIGLDSAAYVPRLAEAKKTGQPAPPMPAALKHFTQINQSCGGPSMTQ